MNPCETCSLRSLGCHDKRTEFADTICKPWQQWKRELKEWRPDIFKTLKRSKAMIYSIVAIPKAEAGMVAAVTPEVTIQEAWDAASIKERGYIAHISGVSTTLAQQKTWRELTPKQKTLIIRRGVIPKAIPKAEVIKVIRDR